MRICLQYRTVGQLCLINTITMETNDIVINAFQRSKCQDHNDKYDCNWSRWKNILYQFNFLDNRFFPLKIFFSPLFISSSSFFLWFQPPTSVGFLSHDIGRSLAFCFLVILYFACIVICSVSFGFQSSDLDIDLKSFR